MDESKFYIHIGTWKTGSSTIQYHLKHNIPKLKSEGIIYLPRKNKIVEDYKVIREIQEIDEGFIRRSREKLAHILEDKRKINKDYRFLTSSESFSGDPFIGFKNVSLVAQTLKEITRDFNLDVNIIVYIRRQDDFIESMYTQSIHLGASHSFEEFLSEFDQNSFNWENLLKSYSNYFGRDKLIVRRYHKEFLPEENSLIQSFGQIIDSEFLKNYTSTNSRNRGLSRDALEITRITNQYFDSDNRYQLRNIFQEVNSKEPFEKYSFFKGDERLNFLSRYSESNFNVLNEYFNKEEIKLFPMQDRKDMGEPYSELTLDAVIINFSKAVLAINHRLLQKENKIQKEFRNMFIRKRIQGKLIATLNRYPNIKSIVNKVTKRS